MPSGCRQGSPIISTPNASRAGLGLRALALALDLALVGLLISGIGIWVTVSTDGQVRLGNTIADTVTCVAAEGLPAGVRLPEDYKVANVRHCTRSVAGIAHDWTLTAVEDTSTGRYFADGRQIVLPLDRAGHTADPFYLDGLTPLILVAYLFLLEWRYGATVGKRVLGIRVQAVNGAGIDACQAAKRSAMRLLPFLALTVSAIYLGVDDNAMRFMAFEPPIDTKLRFDLWPWTDAETLDFRGVDDLVMIAFVLNYAITLARRTLPWHDRWAGTEAVRV